MVSYVTPSATLILTNISAYIYGYYYSKQYQQFKTFWNKKERFTPRIFRDHTLQILIF